ncbi:MAG: DUF4143 domain-containing protein [Gammaproteobacteria bacterium]|nr:DUF4143 domain-containing protein [Gammaproteobacteria bacterium]
MMLALMAANYLKRIVDAELSELLGASGAVLIEGAKASGKTATALRAASSGVMLDVDDNARQMASLEPAMVLAGNTPRLIDEWQIEPSIWNHVRRETDRRSHPGQFILTGSAVPADDASRHTGAGRFTRLRMRPLSLYEAGRSSGEISLGGLLDGRSQRAERSELSIASAAELICAGGWPGNIGKPLSAALRVNRGYVDEICRADLSRVSGKRRDPIKVERLVRSLARNIATPVAASMLAADVGGSGSGNGLKRDTAAEYMEDLERLMVVENQPAWGEHLRSRATLRTTPVRHFVDPSIAVAALRASPESLLRDLQFLGFLFESMAVRDLRIYAQAADARVYHYREQDGLEVDAIVEAADGRWAAFEVKLGERRIAEGAKSLRRLAERARGSGHEPPAALAVITLNGYGFTDGNEVGIIPIGALGP